MTQDQTQTKKKMSIDDEPPQAWNKLNSKYKYQLQWDEENEEYKDDAPNEHPVFGEQNMVDNPPHYNNGGIECIEAIEAMLSRDEYIGYLRGNALKYMWRFRYKSKPFEDLRKARWYEERLMKFLLDNQDAV